MSIRKTGTFDSTYRWFFLDNRGLNEAEIGDIEGGKTLVIMDSSAPASEPQRRRISRKVTPVRAAPEPMPFSDLDVDLIHRWLLLSAVGLKVYSYLGLALIAKDIKSVTERLVGAYSLMFSLVSLLFMSKIWQRKRVSLDSWVFFGCITLDPLWTTAIGVVGTLLIMAVKAGTRPPISRFNVPENPSPAAISSSNHKHGPLGLPWILFRWILRIMMCANLFLGCVILMYCHDSSQKEGKYKVAEALTLVVAVLILMNKTWHRKRIPGYWFWMLLMGLWRLSMLAYSAMDMWMLGLAPIISQIPEAVADPVWKLFHS